LDQGFFCGMLDVYHHCHMLLCLKICDTVYELELEHSGLSGT